MKKVLFFLLSVLLTFTSCHKKDACSALPQQVDVLAVLHVADLYEKAEIDEPLLQQLGDDWRALLENPSETGIDWESPVYLYMTDNTQGVVASISSDKKLSQCLMQFGFKVTEADDYTWASNGNYLLGYSSSVLVGNNIYGDEKLFRQRIRKQMEQDEDRSFSSTEDFAQLVNQQSDITCLFPAGLVMNLLKESLPMIPNLAFEDMNCRLSVLFENGQLTSGLQLYGRSEEANETLEQLKSTLTPVKGTFVESIPSGSSVFMTLGTKGSDLFRLLQQNPGLGMILTLVSQSVPMDELFAAQQGDIAVSLSGNDQNAMLFMAEMSDTQLLENSKLWTDGGREFGIRSEGNNQYSVALDGASMYFGAQDKHLYLTTSLPLLQNLGPNTEIQRLSGQITGSYGFIWLDAKQLLQNSSIPSAYRNQVSWMNCLTVRAVSPDKYELQLASTDSNVNILKTILQCIRP